MTSTLKRSVDIVTEEDASITKKLKLNPDNSVTTTPTTAATASSSSLLLTVPGDLLNHINGWLQFEEMCNMKSINKMFNKSDVYSLDSIMKFNTKDHRIWIPSSNLSTMQHDRTDVLNRINSIVIVPDKNSDLKIYARFENMHNVPISLIRNKRYVTTRDVPTHFTRFPSLKHATIQVSPIYTRTKTRFDEEDGVEGAQNEFYALDIYDVLVDSFLTSLTLKSQVPGRPMLFVQNNINEYEVYQPNVEDLVLDNVSCHTACAAMYWLIREKYPPRQEDRLNKTLKRLTIRNVLGLQQNEFCDQISNFQALEYIQLGLVDADSVDYCLNVLEYVIARCNRLHTVHIQFAPGYKPTLDNALRKRVWPRLMNVNTLVLESLGGAASEFIEQLHLLATDDEDTHCVKLDTLIFIGADVVLSQTVFPYGIKTLCFCNSVVGCNTLDGRHANTQCQITRMAFIHCDVSSKEWVYPFMKLPLLQSVLTSGHEGVSIHHNCGCDNTSLTDEMMKTKIRDIDSSINHNESAWTKDELKLLYSFKDVPYVCECKFGETEIEVDKEYDDMYTE